MVGHVYRKLNDYEYYLADEMYYFFELNPSGEWSFFGEEEKVRKFIKYKIRKEKLRQLQDL
jgi:hypothetical protein